MCAKFVFELLESRRLLAATTLRIDVGGDGFVEPSGKTFAADRGFTENEAGARHIPFGVFGEVAEPGRVAIGDAVELMEPSLLDQAT